jgi:hypothetical protein
MKALVIVENNDVARLVDFVTHPLGIDIIRYNDPLKALDNLEEIRPDAIVMSAQDFPRHWKSIVVNIRASRPKGECAVILLKGDWFPFEEAAKAAHLGVNGVVRENLTDKTERSRFQQILKRYMEIDDSRLTDRQVPDELDRVDFMFSHPERFTPVPGRIETISSNGLSFLPDSPALASDLEIGTVIPDASLRIDNTIIFFACRLVRAGHVMAFSFDGMPPESRELVALYLNSRTEREMKALLKK